MNGKSWGINWLANSSVILIFIIMFSLFKGIFGGVDDELKQILEEKPTLVDVRTVSEYAGGTVKGAVNIPLSEISHMANKLNKSKAIVVFCQSGNRSGQALQILKNQGFTKVYNGGGWRSLKAIIEQ